MLRLHARNPILLTAAAAIIVVGAFATLAPHLSTRSGPIEAPQYERMMVAQRSLAAPPAPTPAATPAPMGGASAAVEIARTGTIALLAVNVDTAVSRISELAREAGGNVFGLDAQSAGDGSGSQSATLTIRIEATRFDAMMAQLATLGTVRSRSVRAEDLASSITDSSARLRNLKRTESDMLKIMDRSGRVGEILDVENQLSNVREQIETLQADVASMRGRVAYSTIDIQLNAEAKSAPVEPNALTQLKNTFSAASHSLADTTIALIAAFIWAVVFAPFAIAFGVVLWVARRLLHRYRGYMSAGRS